MKKWREIPPILEDSLAVKGIHHILESTLQEYYMHAIMLYYHLACLLQNRWCPSALLNI